ncbi:MAG: LLM class flavin-dependent oxidoreductase, partial [Trebonia sp.]
MSSKPLKQIHLAAHFPGVNNTTVWSDPAAGSHIEFDSFRRFAQTAERGKFDFMFLAEGLRLREQNGQIYDLDVVGRPDTFTILAALAAVTEHLGLTGTINSTFNEPYEVARQFASLDHLSGGRAAWNVVTSWDAFTGENFRRADYLADHARREGYVLLTPPVVKLDTDDDLEVGVFGIATRMAQDAKRGAGEPVDRPPPSATMIYKPEDAPATVQQPTEAASPVDLGLQREVCVLTWAGERRELEGSRLVLGRSKDADIQVADPNVSRRHAEVRQDGPATGLVDLDSTNGIEVAGQRVKR